MSDVISTANAELSAQLSQDQLETPSFDLFRGSFFPEPPAKRFASFSESELEQLVSERHSKKMKEVTNWSVTAFKGQRSLTTKSFKFESDAAGRNYATMSHDELFKNHPGGLKDVESTEKEARMYETEDQGDGYKALKLCLQKVNPNCTAFFQYPKKNCRAEDAVWFEARPLGMNSLAKMMKIISEEARLSKIYTNHCVRATAITLWSNAGISNRHIMAISGHRSAQSLVSYNSRPSISQLHNCSQVLSKAFFASTMQQPKSSKRS
ncbi:hypothetical protein ACROYT_G033403 [Oculina patagonica]